MSIIPPAIPRIPETKDVTRPETARIETSRAELMADVRLSHRARVLVDSCQQHAARFRVGAAQEQAEEGVGRKRVGRAQLRKPREELRKAVEVRDVERD